MDATTQQPPAPSAAESDDDRILREQVEARRAAREQKEQAKADREPRAGREVINAVADAGPEDKAGDVSDEELESALDWFLSDDDGDYSYDLKLNVGTPKEKRWVAWTIKPVDLDTLRRIRQASAPKGKRRRPGQEDEIDEVIANLRIVIAGTVEPDLKALGKEQGRPPEELLRKKFAHKPGILGQIAGEIMGISGYDDEDVREVEAAGN